MEKGPSIVYNTDHFFRKLPFEWKTPIKCAQWPVCKKRAEFETADFLILAFKL